MKQNLIMTYLHGNDCMHMLETELYLQSLSRLKNCVKAVFVNDVNDGNIEILSRIYDIIIPDNENPELAHLSIYKWLCEHVDEYEYVINTDLRDVIFQRDPFEFLKAHPEKNMFFTLEGMTIQESECNRIWHQWYRNNIRFHKEEYLDSYVINGGVWGGKIEQVMSFCLFIFTQVNMISRAPIINQQSMGYLYKFWKMNPQVMMCHPYEDVFCCTGEAIKYDNIDVYFNEDNIACNKDGEPYYIFHQWDRTEVAQKLLEKQYTGLKFSI